MQKIRRDMLSNAGEFAVASELGRRNIYAQPTFGHLKKTDLLIVGETGKPYKIEVKSQQTGQWPNCRGIPDKNSILVLVDYAGKTDAERPDFYILTFDDWLVLVQNAIQHEKQKHPHWKAELDSDNCPVWKNQLNKDGKPYMGCGIKVSQVVQHKEAWEKITRLLNK